MRTTLRVLAAKGLRVRMADATGQTCTPSVRHLLITSEGLYDERSRSTTPGPVEVVASRYITRLVAAGNLLEVKSAAAPPAQPPTPVASPTVDEPQPVADPAPKHRGRGKE